MNINEQIALWLNSDPHDRDAVEGADLLNDAAEELTTLRAQLAAVATSEWDRISRERDEAHRERDAYRDALDTARREVESMGELARATARHAEELRGLLREAVDGRFGEGIVTQVTWNWFERSAAALEGKS